MTTSICRAVCEMAPRFLNLNCNIPPTTYGVSILVALGVLRAGYQVVVTLKGRNIVTAAEGGEIQRVRALITSKRENEEDLAQWDEGSQALLRAIEKGWYGVFSALLYAGIAIPDTALHAALRHRRGNMALQLLDRCPSDARDDQGNTPLMLAAKMGLKDLVGKLLAKNKSLVDAQNSEGQTALHLAAREYPDIVKVLIDADTALDLTDHSGQTPLHYAADQDTAKSVERLLAAGADPNVQDADGKIPLHLTVNLQGARLEAARCLLTADRLDPNVFSEEGLTPAMDACYMTDGKDELARLFIDSGLCGGSTGGK